MHQPRPLGLDQGRQLGRVRTLKCVSDASIPLRVKLTELNWNEMFTIGGASLAALLVIARFLIRG